VGLNAKTQTAPASASSAASLRAENLDKDAVGFRAEAMGQGQDKVVGLPEAIRGKTSRRPKELVLSLHPHDELKRASLVKLLLHFL